MRTLQKAATTISMNCVHPGDTVVAHAPSGDRELTVRRTADDLVHFTDERGDERVDLRSVWNRRLARQQYSLLLEG